MDNTVVYKVPVLMEIIQNTNLCNNSPAKYKLKW